MGLMVGAEESEPRRRGTEFVLIYYYWYHDYSSHIVVLDCVFHNQSTSHQDMTIITIPAAALSVILLVLVMESRSVRADNEAWQCGPAKHKLDRTAKASHQLAKIIHGFENHQSSP